MATITQKKRAAVKKPAPRRTAVNYLLTEEEYFNLPTKKRLEAALEQARRGEGIPVTVEVLRQRLANIIANNK